MTTDFQAVHAALVLVVADELGLGPGQRSDAHIVVAIRALKDQADHDPCRSCGADPARDPPTGEEIPIIKGALDAQAVAETRAKLSARALECTRRALKELVSQGGHDLVGPLCNIIDDPHLSMRCLCSPCSPLRPDRACPQHGDFTSPLAAWVRTTIVCAWCGTGDVMVARKMDRQLRCPGCAVSGLGKCPPGKLESES